MSNIVNLLPVILVAAGALVSLAAEPFIKDENKHKVLPWVASFFIALAAGAYYLTTNDTFMDLYAMDPIRRVLGAFRSSPGSRMPWPVRLRCLHSSMLLPW